MKERNFFMEIQLWKKILDPYELAVKELTVKFEHLIEEHRLQGLYSPLEQVTGRVKSVSSILNKMRKKKILMEEMEEKVEDIAGIRIICQFVEDIKKVVEIIKSRSDMEVKEERDYITNMKDSGYRSYHVIIYYPIETLEGTRKIQAEIQIRTLGMNFWSTIEHSLQYKYEKNIPDHIRRRLTKAADAIIVLDREMSTVRGEIMDAQNSLLIQESLVSDILNTIHNLYHLSNKRELGKIQDEFPVSMHRRGIGNQSSRDQLTLFAKIHLIAFYFAKHPFADRFQCDPLIAKDKLIVKPLLQPDGQLAAQQCAQITLRKLRQHPVFIFRKCPRRRQRVQHRQGNQ